MDSSRLCSIIYVLGTAAGTKLIQVDDLDPLWLNTIRQCDMPDIQRAVDNKLNFSGSITVHHGMSESRTRFNFSVVIELFLTVLLGTMYIDRFINSIHPPKRTIVPFLSSPVLILITHETGSGAEIDK